MQKALEPWLFAASVSSDWIVERLEVKSLLAMEKGKGLLNAGSHCSEDPGR